MIVLFCGPPASGKSAIVKRLVKELEDWKLIASDEFKRKTYRHMFIETERWAGRVRYLILDGTFYKKEWRDRIREIAEERREEVLTVYVTCSLKTCLERNRLRKEQIDEKAVSIIYNQIEKPEKASLSLDTDVLSVDEAVRMLTSALCLSRVS